MKKNLIIFLLTFSCVLWGQVNDKVFVVSKGATIVHNPDGSKTVRADASQIQNVDFEDMEVFFDVLEESRTGSYIVKDTITIRKSDRFHIPQILTYFNESYYCLDNGGNFIIEVSTTGQITQTLNLSDIVEEIRDKIGSISPDQYLQSRGATIESGGIIAVPDKSGYNKILNVKGPANHITNHLLHLILKAFEIDTTENEAMQVQVDQFPLKSFIAFLEINTSDFSVNRVFRLPELKAGRQYNANAFHVTDDFTLMIPIINSSEKNVGRFPAFAELSINEEEFMQIDRYWDQGLEQFTLSEHWKSSFFKPVILSFENEIYYIDQSEMCFYKIGDVDYRWCIPDLPPTSLQEIIASLSTRTSINDFLVTSDYLKIWIGVSEDLDSDMSNFYSYKLDLKNKQVLEKRFLFEDTCSMTCGYRVINGTFHKLLVNEQDEMKIVRFTMNE